MIYIRSTSLILIGLVFVLISSNSGADEILRQKIEQLNENPVSLITQKPFNNSKLIAKFYEDTHYAPVWLKKSTFTPIANDLLITIKRVDAEGLSPNDYYMDTLQNAAPISDAEAADYELLMSDVFFTLYRHLASGKINPRSLDVDWHSKNSQIDPINVLLQAVPSDSLQPAFAEVLPQQARYHRLKVALEHLRQKQNIEWEPLGASPLIKPGQKDNRLAEIQKRLLFWGDLKEQSLSDHYDQPIVDAISHFQSRHGLKSDGVIGQETIRELNVSVKERIKTVLVNLERWRWLDNQFGSEFIVVNIANFDLRLYRNNVREFSTPVIVGRYLRKSPVFSDQIRYIVFNPTWTVPHKLAVEDKLPEILKNPNYLTQNNFKVFPLNSNVPIDPATIDWTALSKRYFPYRLVQAPGPNNALGLVKIMFPNEFDVYLHDTPARELFKETERAFSSGCIRVSNPLGLVEALLNKQGWDKTRIDQVVSTNTTQTVYLSKPIPVHIEYWTAWVDRTETLHFRKDIYKRDQALYTALSH